MRLHYLDGLRGWAALSVLLWHTLRAWLLEPAAMKERGLSWVTDIINMSPIGVVTHGTLAVFVFFLISGVVLSYPVITSTKPATVVLQMGAMRYPRLTIPILASGILAYFLLMSGLMQSQSAAKLSNNEWLSTLYQFEPSLPWLMWFSLGAVYTEVPPELSWNAVLWTMPYELCGSFLLFGVLFVIRPRPIRVLLALALSLLLIKTMYFGFFAGLLISECLAWRDGRRPAYIGSIMVAGAVAGGIMMNSEFIPSSFRVMNILALFLVFGVSLSPTAVKILSSRVSRFLGMISFPLYLTHLLVICSASSAFYIVLQPRVSFVSVVIAVLTSTVILSILIAYVFAVMIETITLGAVKYAIKRLLTNRQAVLSAISELVSGRRGEGQGRSP